MGKFVDLTGQHFGRLTVTKKSNRRGNNGEIFWECACDCGSAVTVCGVSLRNGRTQSCGCYKRERASEGFVDLTGQRFGKLTVVKKVDIRDRFRRVYWECACSCGNTVIANGQSLRDGRTLSCGCLKAERMSKVSKSLIIHSTAPCRLNHTLDKRNTTGVRGVSYDQQRGRYHAYIRFQGKNYNLGYYKDLEAARAKRERAEKALWGGFIKEHPELESDALREILENGEEPGSE